MSGPSAADRVPPPRASSQPHRREAAAPRRARLPRRLHQPAAIRRHRPARGSPALRPPRSCPLVVRCAPGRCATRRGLICAEVLRVTVSARRPLLAEHAPYADSCQGRRQQGDRWILIASLMSSPRRASRPRRPSPPGQVAASARHAPAPLPMYARMPQVRRHPCLLRARVLRAREALKKTTQERRYNGTLAKVTEVLETNNV